MNNAPAASRLILLSQLPGLAVGEKVRFLGCVDAYETRTATLSLKNRYAGSSTDVISATVNVANIVDALNIELTQIGAWVNVIGYVRASTSIRPTVESKSVDAVMVWAAGAIRLDAYEAAVQDLQATTV